MEPPQRESLAAFGVTLNYRRRTFTVAFPDADGAATLVAVTVTWLGEGTDDGAVYSPLTVIIPNVEFPPATPFTFHVTAWLAAFCTVAPNCW